jgi:cell division protein FtsQ
MNQSNQIKNNKYQAAPNFEGLFFILFICLIGLIFLNSEFFEVKTVLIQGNQTLSTEDILCNTNLNLSQNIFQINYHQLQKTILRNPKILSAQVYYQLPNQVMIRVQERHQLCLLLYLGNLLIIGEDAVVMGIKAENEPIKLPVVTGIGLNRLQIGGTIKDPQFKIALEILRLADENLRVILGEIDIRNYLLYIDLPNAHHTLKVELGNADQLDEKISKNLRSILSHTVPDELSKIDLRVVSFPTAIKNTAHK